MKKINLEKYNSFILDFDGVILDSNNIKKAAIAESVQAVLSQEKVIEFVDYFVGLNGVPREEKIAKYAPKDKYEYVLKKYEDIINLKLKDAKLISGVKNFIKTLNDLKKNLVVLSGGTQSEVLQLLADRGLSENFNGVYGGPKNKEENLQGLILESPVLYFGDSQVDYEVAKNNSFDFVFVYGASNILDWRSKVKEWQIDMFINDFSNLGTRND
jgi:phosphoglycolate phosphatase-like HAD superfamily hydrolase